MTQSGAGEAEIPPVVDLYYCIAAAPSVLTPLPSTFGRGTRTDGSLTNAAQGVQAPRATVALSATPQTNEDTAVLRRVGLRSIVPKHWVGTSVLGSTQTILFSQVSQAHTGTHLHLTCMEML